MRERMNSNSLKRSLIISAAIHAAVLSGILPVVAGVIGGGGQAAVVFVNIESPGDAGASAASAATEKLAASKTAGSHRKTTPATKAQPAPAPETESAGESGPGETGQEETRASGAESGSKAEYGQVMLWGNSDGKGNGGDIGDGAGSGAAGISSPAAIANMPKPVYPRHSRIHGEEGTVMLEAEVAPDGKPAKARIVHSSGYRHLDDAALAALEKASFTPARIFGAPVASTKRISIRFNINDQ